MMFCSKNCLTVAKDANSTKLYIENSSERAACLFLEPRSDLILALSSARLM